MNKKLLFTGGALFIGLLMAEPASAARHGGYGGRGGHRHFGGVHHRGVHVTGGRAWYAAPRVSYRSPYRYGAYRSYATPYRTIIADPWAAAATSSYGYGYGARYAAVSRGYSACGPTYYPGYSYPYYNTYGCPAPVTCYTF